MKNERKDDAEVKRIIEDSSAEGRREKYTLALVKAQSWLGEWTLSSFCQRKEDNKGSNVM